MQAGQHVSESAANQAGQQTRGASQERLQLGNEDGAGLQQQHQDQQPQLAHFHNPHPSQTNPSTCGSIVLSRPAPSPPLLLPLLAAPAAGPAPLGELPFLLGPGTLPLLLLSLPGGLPPASEDTRLPRLKGQLPIELPSLRRAAPLLPASPSSSPLPLLLSPLPLDASREP